MGTGIVFPNSMLDKPSKATSNREAQTAGQAAPRHNRGTVSGPRTLSGTNPQHRPPRFDGALANAIPASTLKVANGDAPSPKTPPQPTGTPREDDMDALSLGSTPDLPGTKQQRRSTADREAKMAVPESKSRRRQAPTGLSVITGYEGKVQRSPAADLTPPPGTAGTLSAHPTPEELARAGANTRNTPSHLNLDATLGRQGRSGAAVEADKAAARQAAQRRRLADIAGTHALRHMPLDGDLRDHDDDSPGIWEHTGSDDSSPETPRLYGDGHLGESQLYQSARHRPDSAPTPHAQLGNTGRDSDSALGTSNIDDFVAGRHLPPRSTPLALAERLLAEIQAGSPRSGTSSPDSDFMSPTEAEADSARHLEEARQAQAKFTADLDALKAMNPGLESTIDTLVQAATHRPQSTKISFIKEELAKHKERQAQIQTLSTAHPGFEALVRDLVDSGYPLDGIKTLLEANQGRVGGRLTAEITARTGAPEIPVAAISVSTAGAGKVVAGRTADGLLAILNAHSVE